MRSGSSSPSARRGRRPWRSCTFTPRAKPAGGYPGFTIAVHEVGGSQRSWALPSEDARFQPEVGGPGKKHEYRMTFLDVDKDDTIPFKQCEVFKP